MARSKKLKKFTLLCLVLAAAALVYFNVCSLPIYADTIPSEEKDWIQNPINGHYYRLTEPLSWPEAENQAMQWGGHLVTINEREEELWLKNQFGLYEYFWIGLNDINSEGNWEWVNGEPVTYTNWAERQPDNYLSIEDSAIMNWANSGQINSGLAKNFGDSWNDIQIDGISRGIVEKAVTELPKGKIAFMSDRDGNSEIYIMNADGSGQTNLTNNPNDESVPSFSPDGSRIVFESDRDGNGEIYIMNIDGSGQTNLTNTREWELGPSFSPEGTKIAFRSDRDVNVGAYAFSPDEDINWEIYSMNTDGSEQVRLTNNQVWDWEPHFSPDGSKIVYNSTSLDNNADIYIMNADGSGQVNLTNNPAKEMDPCFSSDGTKIAFASSVTDPEIYIMNIDGSGRTRLTNNPATDRQPCIYSGDGKVKAVDPVGTPEYFRTAGPLIPEITREIPTLINVVKTKPAVIYTNLLLAILTMIPFAVAAELFTVTLAENEEDWKRKIRKIPPVAFFRRLNKKIEKLVSVKMGRHLLARNMARLLGVILFYGFAYSLLDPTWKLFSVKGLVLLIDMTLAYGIVGIADDIIQWRALKKWGVPAEFSVKPTNLLVSVISISVSRLLPIVPGMMFGTPEALRVDKSVLGIAKRDKLLKISLITFLVIGSSLWSMTIATYYIKPLLMPGAWLNVVSGIEGFLLLVFAVTLENTFIQMLGFPGGFGRVFRQKNRWVWFAGLVAVAFVFYLTLINPRGELLGAFQENGVILFISAALIFVVAAFGLWLYFRRKRKLP
jgi:hypothetical protein